MDVSMPRRSYRVALLHRTSHIVKERKSTTESMSFHDIILFLIHSLILNTSMYVRTLACAAI